MKTALAIRPVAFEDLGTLADVLTRHGYEISYLEAGLEALPPDALQAAEVLIVLGGPISANDDAAYRFLPHLREQIATRIEAARPTLGICLGAQLIARALGARVYALDEKEIGWSELTLTPAGKCSSLRHLEGQAVLHWHGETFDLPDGAEHLAQTDACRNQAFAISSHVLGLQCHAEVTCTGLERWYIGHALELSQAGLSIPTLRQQAEWLAPRLANCAEIFFDEWLRKL